MSLLAAQTLFQSVVVMVGAMSVSACSLVYLRRVRMERPAIGVFNGRDIAVLFVFIVSLPALYLVLPHWALTSVLVVTFAASLSIGYRSLVGSGPLWTSVGLAVGVNIWMARTMLGTVAGWQVYWALTSVIVLLGSVAVSNLYVQGGMRLRHVAWFALFLAGYDAFFSLVVPLTAQLADAFIGYPLDPSIGMRVGIYNANIGLGDLLVYGLFTIAAFKAYGRRAANAAMAVVAVFGALAPATAPLVIDAVTRGASNVVVPAQTFFGPAAFLTYLWLARRGPERTMVEFLSSPDALASEPVAARRATRPATQAAT